MHKYQKSLYFQLWREEGKELKPLLRSRDDGTEYPFFQNLAEGFSDQPLGGQRWRFYRQHQAESLLDVVVGQSDTARDELAREIAWHSIEPFVYGLPLLGMVASLLIFFGLRPLRRLAQDLRNRSSQELTELEFSHLPTELRPPVKAMNGLLLELSRAFERERRFTSDAAHELRTPLAGLRAQLELARFEGESPEARSTSIEKAWLATTRMQHLISQLLVLCRLDVSAHLERGPVQLDELTENVCADLAPLAAEKKIELSLAAVPVELAEANRELLYVLLRNLIDNALRYTPEGGQISVSLEHSQKQAILAVGDSGSGVTQEQMQFLGQRFRRLTPTLAEGVGLGLSIVARVADIHHAQVRYSPNTALGGLRVTICIPLNLHPGKQHS